MAQPQSYAERVAKLASDRASLKAKHENTIDSLKAQITSANGVFESMNSKIEADANEAHEQAHRDFQKRAAQALDPVVAAYVEKGDRASSNAVAAVVRTLQTDKVQSVGEGLSHEIAHSLTALIVSRESGAAASFGNADAFRCSVLGCGEASFAAVKCLLSSDEPSLHASALDKLERAVSRARSCGAVVKGAELWAATRFGGSKTAIETARKAIEREAQKERDAKGFAALRNSRGWQILSGLDGVMRPASVGSEFDPVEAPSVEPLDV